MVEALDARELAVRRGEIEASAAWRIRVYRGRNVVHGVWFKGGSCCVFVLIRQLAAPGSSAQGGKQVKRSNQGMRQLSGASLTSDAVGGCWQGADEVDWERLMAGLQHLDSDWHSC